jgi:hypothetical protein
MSFFQVILELFSNVTTCMDVRISVLTHACFYTQRADAICGQIKSAAGRIQTTTCGRFPSPPPLLLLQQTQSVTQSPLRRKSDEIEIPLWFSACMDGQKEDDCSIGCFDGQAT